VLNVRGDVDILLFPVKPSWCRRVPPRAAAGVGARWVALRLLVGGALCSPGLAACGYRSLASSTSNERLCVLAVPAKVPDFGAVQGALDGAREELARHSGLGENGVYPCLQLEVLRVDEVAAGVAAGNVAGAAQPQARGTAVALVGRAWVQQGADAPLSRDTGDVRRVVRLQTTSGPLEGTRHDRGVEVAGQELGRDLARRVLGLPTPSDEVP